MNSWWNYWTEALCDSFSNDWSLWFRCVSVTFPGKVTFNIYKTINIILPLSVIPLMIIIIQVNKGRERHCDMCNLTWIDVIHQKYRYYFSFGEISLGWMAFFILVSWHLVSWLCHIKGCSIHVNGCFSYIWVI